MINKIYSKLLDFKVPEKTAYYYVRKIDGPATPSKYRKIFIPDQLPEDYKLFYADTLVSLARQNRKLKELSQEIDPDNTYDINTRKATDSFTFTANNDEEPFELKVRRKTDKIPAFIDKFFRLLINTSGLPVIIGEESITPIYSLNSGIYTGVYSSSKGFITTVRCKSSEGVVQVGLNVVLSPTLILSELVDRLKAIDHLLEGPFEEYKDSSDAVEYCGAHILNFTKNL